VGIAVSVVAFAIVYGLAARQAGLSIVEGLAMSLIAFAGAAQFAALGLLTQGVPWVGIIVLTALLNARHLLYAASLSPWFASRPRRERAWSAHFLTDELFALVLPAFRALGRHDTRTYLIAMSLTFFPWVGATILGMLFGELLPAPETLGLDVVFPAAMAGLAVALVVDRRAFTAAVAGTIIGVAVALQLGSSVGILAGGLLGPALALLVPETPAEVEAAEASASGTRGLP
jgi:4-azaleucine resistance transporter AzlC